MEYFWVAAAGTLRMYFLARNKNWPAFWKLNGPPCVKQPKLYRETLPWHAHAPYTLRQYLYSEPQLLQSKDETCVSRHVICHLAFWLRTIRLKRFGLPHTTEHGPCGVYSSGETHAVHSVRLLADLPARNNRLHYPLGHNCCGREGSTLCTGHPENRFLRANHEGILDQGRALL